MNAQRLKISVEHDTISKTVNAYHRQSLKPSFGTVQTSELFLWNAKGRIGGQWLKADPELSYEQLQQKATRGVKPNGTKSRAKQKM